MNIENPCPFTHNVGVCVFLSYLPFSSSTQMLSVNTISCYHRTHSSHLTKTQAQTFSVNVVLNDTDQIVRSRRIFTGRFVFGDSHELCNLRAVTDVFTSRCRVSYTITRDLVPEPRRHAITPAEKQCNIDISTPSHVTHSGVI